MLVGWEWSVLVVGWVNSLLDGGGLTERGA